MIFKLGGGEFQICVNRTWAREYHANIGCSLHRIEQMGMQSERSPIIKWRGEGNASERWELCTHINLDFECRNYYP